MVKITRKCFFCNKPVEIFPTRGNSKLYLSICPKCWENYMPDFIANCKEEIRKEKENAKKN